MLASWPFMAILMNFNQTEENINDYLDRLDFYLEANNESAPEKKSYIANCSWAAAVQIAERSGCTQ